MKIALTAHSPIAVIGISCRFPMAASPDAFWRLLRGGASAITDTPVDRWEMGDLFGSDLLLPGVLRGGFLDRIDRFDPGFFGIAPREAMVMDPQQRLILELSWEAFEDAGIVPGRLAGSQTGVFVGAISSDYGDLFYRRGIDAVTRYALTGTHRGIIANRVSYALGLRGPSLTVDAAQSSALVAVHIACESLRRGESTLALAGGVNLNISLDSAMRASKFGALSPDGRCFTFDARANGYVRGEGAGVVALKPLSCAVAEGDSVYCVIKGSAVNNDGAGAGLSAPDQLAQEDVLRLAYRRARVKRTDVQYVELHGTGTRLGDQVEAAALGSVIGAGRTGKNPLLVGSAKTNVGHLEGAAGIVGLIKAILCVKHREIPPSLNFVEPSPQIPMDALHLRVQQALSSWPDLNRSLLCGVSSFGMGGTNCHVVLSELSLSREDEAGNNQITPVSSPVDVLPWTVSGKSEPALREQAQRLLEHVESSPQLDAKDVGYSLAVSRSVFGHRAVVLGRNREELLGGLGALARGEPAASVTEGVADTGRSGVVFLFPGQGSQWEGMALGLLDSSPVFAEHMRRCSDALAPFIDWSLEDVLRGANGAPGFDRVDVVQPVLFAVMVSLAALWRACGVHPDAVVGHSQGEVAAAHVAGGLSLEDAARVVALRSRLLTSLAGQGGMVSVSLTTTQIAKRMQRWGERVSLAAVNGPSSVVLSGDGDALEELLAECAVDGVRGRRIPVNYASHSPQVDTIREELLELLAPIAPRAGDVPFYSTVTARLLDTAKLNAEYWHQGLRQTVQFEQVIRALLGDGQHRTFVEISPHTVLTLGVQETVDETVIEPSKILVTGSLRRHQGGLERFLSSLAEVHVHGVDVDWGAIFAGSGTRRVSLPTYAFQRESYWLDSAALGTGDIATAGLGAADHPLLGAAVRLADNRGWLFTGRLSLQTHSWLADYAAMGVVLLPGTAVLELALRAGSEVGCNWVQALTLEAPLTLHEQGGVQLQLSVGEPDETGQRSLSIYARPEGTAADGLCSEETWTRHASGVLGELADLDSRLTRGRAALLAGDVWPPAGAVEMGVNGLYDRLAERGYDYGPGFQGLSAAWRRGDEVFAEVRLPEDQRTQAARFSVHPALLDSALHALGLNLPGDDGEALRLPFSWSGVGLYAAGAGALRVCLFPAGADRVSVVVADENGALVLSAQSLVLRPVSLEQLDGARRRVSGTKDSLIKRLALAPQSDWNIIVLELVKEHVAGVLGHASGEEIDATRNFLELGLDSSAALELRNRLNTATGLHLPAILAIDYPTATVLSSYILNMAFSDSNKVNGLDHSEDDIRHALASASLAPLREAGLLELGLND